MEINTNKIVQFKQLRAPKNLRIAVMFNGSGRHFDRTGSIYAAWNNLFSNVTFDFYVATWKDNDDSSKFGDAIDYSKLDWITHLERLDITECLFNIKAYEKKAPGEHQPHYMWSLYKVNELRRKSKVDYDLVIQTRSDMVFYGDFINQIVQLASTLNKGNEETRMMFSQAGTVRHIGKGSNTTPVLWNQDLYFCSTPYVMDIFSHMFFDYYINPDFPYYSNTEHIKNMHGYCMMHVFTAEYLNYKRIYNCPIGIGNKAHSLIRDAARFAPSTKENRGRYVGWDLKFPSPKQLSDLLDKHGPEFFVAYDPDGVERTCNTKLAYEYFEKTPKE